MANLPYRYVLAERFTKFPGGRKRKNGDHSGEEFREDVALPLLREHEFVIFDLTGSAGYSTGFLDEAFGELGAIFGYKEMKRRVTIVAEDDPDAARTALQRIEDASRERRGA